MTSFLTPDEFADLPIECRIKGHDHEPAEPAVLNESPSDRALRLHVCSRCGDEVRAIEMVPR